MLGSKGDSLQNISHAQSAIVFFDFVLVIVKQWCCDLPLLFGACNLSTIS